MDLTEKVFDFAIKKHKGQTDDYGMDYFINHCLKVGKIIKLLCPKIKI